jgi:hypothetical protein
MRKNNVFPILMVLIITAVLGIGIVTSLQAKPTLHPVLPELYSRGGQCCNSSPRQYCRANQYCAGNDLVKRPNNLLETRRRHQRFNKR